MKKFLALALLIPSNAADATAIARADPQTDMMHDAALFCRFLDYDSSPAGVLAAAREFVVQGVPKQAAIDTINYALVAICPEYQPNVAVTLAILHNQGGFVA